MDNLPTLPTGFAADSNWAGAIDHISPLDGLRGWVVDRTLPRSPTRVVVQASGFALATSWSILLRPDLAPALGRTPRGGLAIGWHLFDAKLVERLAATAPDAVVQVVLPAIGQALSVVCAPLTLGAILVRLREDTHSPPSFPLIDAFETISAAGVLDNAWYRQRASDLPADEDPVLHYLEHGEANGLWPCRYFHPAMVAEALELNETAGALAAYLARPDAVGCTSLHYDQDWYLTQYPVAAECPPLVDYMRNRATRDPNPVLSRAKLLARYPQISSAAAPYDAAFTIAEGKGEAEALHQLLADAAPSSLPYGPIVSDFDLRRRMIAADVFDPAHYVAQRPEAARAPGGPAAHFVAIGDRGLASPHPWFDPLFYCRVELGAVPPEGAFRHFLSEGERHGLRPCALFETAWYQATYCPGAASGGALAHYLAHRAGNTHAPNSWVDLDVLTADQPEHGGDAFAHWMAHGVHAGLPVSRRFDADHVRARYLGGDRSVNPLAAFLDVGLAWAWQPMRPSDLPQASLLAVLGTNGQPGQHYEADAQQVVDVPRAIFFALLLPCGGKADPQGLRMPSRGVPRVMGQVQPRLPLFHPDRSAEARLARRSGLAGFAVPLPAMAVELPDDPTLRLLPIWSDGRDEWLRGRIPLSDSAGASIPAEVLQVLKDGRCLRLAGRPVLVLAREGLAGGDLAGLRARLAAEVGAKPVLLLAQPQAAADPRIAGFDGALEVPVPCTAMQATAPSAPAELLDPESVPRVGDYAGAMGEALRIGRTPWPSVRSLVPDWDDEPRFPGAGLVLRDATPALFADWLSRLVEQAEATPLLGSRLLLVDSWNGWSEGTALLPDMALGHARLNAVARVMGGPNVGKPVAGLAVLAGADPESAVLARGMAVALHAGFGLSPVLLLPEDGYLSLMPLQGCTLPIGLVPGSATPPVMGRRLAAAGISSVLDLAEVEGSMGPVFEAAGLRRVPVSSFPQAPLLAAVGAWPGAAPPMTEALHGLASDLLDLAMPDRPRITAVVPSWCSAEWLPQRMASVFGQTAAIDAVILLDDASTDASIEVAQAAAAAAGRSLRVVRCKHNSGNVSRQWRRAAELAETEFLWIAEADDSADPRFVATLTARLAADPSAAFAFCDSGSMDPSGQLVEADRKAYSLALGDIALLRDGRFEGRDFIRRCLAPRNLVLTASAVVWRTTHLRAAFDAAGTDAEGLTGAGDWRLYLEACRRGAAVHYVAEPLARQRLHPDSVTARLDKRRQFEEVLTIHQLLADEFANEPGVFEGLGRFRTDLERIWGLPMSMHS